MPRALARAALAPDGLGPLQWFEREQRRAKSPRAATEAFARYLDGSDGDDPALHQARDLAHAAAAAPTVPRLLLAAKLSEDRNERARWIARARAELPSSPRDRVRRDLIDVLCAEAELAERGLSPQTALPLYEQALALDPDDIGALSGKARLYDAAGLKQSALSLVEAAVKRNPHGVALLNMYTSGLGELGHAAESRANESLYAALRFDDHGPLVDNIELAVAQRSRELAEHWVKRLLALSPDSAVGGWASPRARTGPSPQPEQALATYERALELAPEDVDVLRELSELARRARPARRADGAALRELLGLEPQDTRRARVPGARSSRSRPRAGRGVRLAARAVPVRSLRPGRRLSPAHPARPDGDDRSSTTASPVSSARSCFSR